MSGELGASKVSTPENLFKAMRADTLAEKDAPSESNEPSRSRGHFPIYQGHPDLSVFPGDLSDFVVALVALSRCHETGLHCGHKE